MRSDRLKILWVMVVMALASTVAAQVPERFTNLQYFPKDIPREELIGIMRGFSFSLSVRCVYCHEGKDGPQLSEVNFASDVKDTKKTARTMLRMVDIINRDYISKLGDQNAPRVECVTCHRGLSKPTTMNALLADVIDKKGIATAVAQYRDLRSKELGDGRYDFGETPLNILTESLLKQKKTQAAAAIMELNVEVNTPPSMWAYNLLAMAHKANNETEKAKTDFQKILDLNPKDQFARKQLDELNAGKP